MAAAAASATGALLPHALLSHRSAPPQVLAVASSFRRLSLYASPRRTTHVVARADAGEPEPDSEAEAVTASADAEEGETEGAVAVAELGEEAADEPPPPPPPSKPAVKFGEIIGVSISSAGFS
jgi:large subunit ribosomal protein L19